MKRCDWVGSGKPHYEHYHDTEWGIAVHDDNQHFEMLILEGAQAGLSWEIILKRRTAYRQAFKKFDPKKVARLSDDYLEQLLINSEIVRNRRKVFAARQNAHVFLSIQQEFGSFDTYVWSFVNHKTQVNFPKTLADLPTTSPEAKALSRDLKKRGMSFVGPTIMYSYMQAIGMVDDHLIKCFRKK